MNPSKLAQSRHKSHDPFRDPASQSFKDPAKSRKPNFRRKTQEPLEKKAQFETITDDRFSVRLLRVPFNELFSGILKALNEKKRDSCRWLPEKKEWQIKHEFYSEVLAEAQELMLAEGGQVEPIPNFVN